MAGKVRRVDFHADEYISGVGGKLRADEQGIYWMICAIIISEGAPVERDERRFGSLCLSRQSDVHRIVEKLLAMGKLTLTDDGKLAQKRAQIEIEVSSKRIQSAVENGSKGGRPRRKDVSDQQNDEAGGYSGGKLTKNQEPRTLKQEDIDSSLRSLSPPTAPKASEQISELMTVLDPTHAKAVVEHRKGFRAKFTPHAAKLLAGKFSRCADPNAAADAMISNGWQGFEPEWLERQVRGAPSSARGRPTASDIFGELGRRLREGPDDEQDAAGRGSRFVEADFRLVSADAKR